MAERARAALDDDQSGRGDESINVSESGQSQRLRQVVEDVDEHREIERLGIVSQQLGRTLSAALATVRPKSRG